MNYVVGQFYQIPCVLVHSARGLLHYLPVLHTHVGDLSGRSHHHIDLRFLSNFQLRDLDLRLDQIVASGPLEIVFRQKKCQRLHPVITRYDQQQERAVRLVEDKVAGKRLNSETLVCPHQGCSLEDTEPTQINGKACLVCPCHGLAWSTDDGSLVRREL